MKKTSCATSLPKPAADSCPQDYKADVLYALAPWNLDCIRHVTGYRMNRHSYCGSNILGGPVDTVARKTREVWSKALNTFGETYVTDRGGMDDTPFLYSSNHSGRFWLTEADVYPDMNKPELLQQAQATGGLRHDQHHRRPVRPRRKRPWRLH